MFPIVLNFAKIKMALIGNGPTTERRRKSLEDAGIKNFVHIPLPLPGGRNIFEGFDIVFIADFDYETSKMIREQVKTAGALVNVEDKTELCDFHVPAIVRRGDLLITASTGAKSPRLTKRLKAYLEEIFGKEWKERVELLAKEREKWKKEGVSIEGLARRTDEVIDREGWLVKERKN